jgi:hypothetical protein
MDFDFTEFEETKPKEQYFQKDYDENKTKKQKWNNKKNWSKNKKSNTKKNSIDLFEEKPEPKPIDFENLKTGKIFTLVFANKDIKLEDNEKKKIKYILDKLKESGFKLRLLCNTVNPILDLLKDFGIENIFVIKPWDKYCKTGNFKSYLPTVDNIQAAAYYYPNFDRLPTGVKYINSAIFEVMFGPANNQALEYVLVYDSYYNGKEIDFKQSSDTAVWYWLPKKAFKDFGFTIFNLYKDEDVKSLLELMGNLPY